MHATCPMRWRPCTNEERDEHKKALQIEAEKAEVGHSLSFNADVYKDLVWAVEAFLVALIGQWEELISLKKPRPSTMLAGDVQLALRILYSDASGVAEEREEGADMKSLDRYFTTRAIRLNMIRAAIGIYEIRDDAVQLVRRILWERFLCLARRTIQALPDGRKLISKSRVREALAEPMPLGWNVKLF